MREFSGSRARQIRTTSIASTHIIEFVVHLIGMITYAKTEWHYNLDYKDLRN